jgi:hypothetical protein
MATILQPELRDLSTTAGELEDLVYVSGEEFDICLDVEIGLVGEAGADLFYVSAISPSAMAAMTKDGPRFLRHKLLMDSFNAASAKEAIERLCRRCNGPDWDTIAEKLARYMQWEYEDYTPFQRQ